MVGTVQVRWFVRFVQAMYTNARCSVRVNGTFCEEFMVKVGVYQGSILIPLLSNILVIEYCHVISDQGYPQELLHADDFVLTAERMEELIEKFKKWKEDMETNGLRLNMKKTKIMVSQCYT